MAFATEGRPSRTRLPREIWLLAGLLAMYLPTYLDLCSRFWGKDDDSQGPIILFIVLGLLYRERRSFSGTPSANERRLGIGLFLFGLVLYVIGRSQEFFQFDVGSQLFVLIGLALAFGGYVGFRRVCFPACFIIFLIPIPPSLLDQILVPLKVAVSQVVTDGLYWLGYPISRSGVVIAIGQYQLQIADACSGLRSMLALSGIGILYVYLLGRVSHIRRCALLLAAIPFAFLANILRVTALVLVTYYLGDQAGADFHDVAGYFEIVLAFASFFFLDLVLARAHRLALSHE